MSGENVALPITGMTCANCAGNIERSLNKIPGIQKATVNFAIEKASVDFDPDQIRVIDLMNNVQRAGYGVVVVAHYDVAVGCKVAAGMVIPIILVAVAVTYDNKGTFA